MPPGSKAQSHRAFLHRRARKLGLSSLLPSTWHRDGTLRDDRHVMSNELLEALERQDQINRARDQLVELAQRPKVRHRSVRALTRRIVELENGRNV